MALLFNYSCNGITNASQLPHGFANITGSPTVGVGDGPGATPINTLHVDGQSAWAWLPNIAIPINSYGLILGAGFNVTAFGGLGATNLFTVGSAGSSTFSNSATVQVGPDGSMHVGLGGAIGVSSASGVFTFGSRHEVELAFSSFAAAGTMTVYLDGVPVTGLIAVNIQAFGINLGNLADGSTIHSVTAGGSTQPNFSGGGSATSTPIVMDSVYACDTTGSHFNSPQGPCISIPYIPSGNGNKSQWTPTGVGSGYQALANVPPNPSEYISDNTSGNEETAATTGPADITAVFGMTIFATQRQDTAGGGRTNAVGIGNGTSEDYSAASTGYGTFPLGTSYKTNGAPYGYNTIANRAWTLGDLSSLQVAVKVAS